MTPDNPRDLIARLRTQSTEIGDRAEVEDLMNEAADALAALTTPQEAGDMSVVEFSRVLGFEDETGAAKLRDIVDPISQWESEMRDHVECPRLCEGCGDMLARTRCAQCGGGGQLPGYNGTVSECGECGGVGFIHEGCVEQSYADLAARLTPQEGDARAEMSESSVVAYHQWRNALGWDRLSDDEGTAARIAFYAGWDWARASMPESGWEYGLRTRSKTHPERGFFSYAGDLGTAQAMFEATRDECTATIVRRIKTGPWLPVGGDDE